jgi:hypothetical protein
MYPSLILVTKKREKTVMCNSSFQRLSRTVMALLTMAIFAGCASVDFNKSLSATNKMAAGFTGGKLSLAQTEEQRAGQSHIRWTILEGRTCWR